MKDKTEYKNIARQLFLDNCDCNIYVCDYPPAMSEEKFIEVVSKILSIKE
jgi:hypothetical protein